jgi:hypothetical protein
VRDCPLNIADVEEIANLVLVYIFATLAEALTSHHFLNPY